MTADVELLPLPEELKGRGKSGATKHYARACVAHATAAKDAEIEALRAKTAVTKGVMDEQIEPMVFWNCPLCDAMYQDQISECDCEPGARTINEVHLYSQQSIEALRAEVERLRRDRDDCLAAREHYASLYGEQHGRAERLAEALREMREYVTAALQDQREAFAGHEDSSDIPGIEADLHKIDTLLREQENDGA